MAKFQFRERIPINVHHTLMQLLSRFQGVRDGLPELIKNSKDQYSRLLLTDLPTRTIVVVVNTLARAIGVIDFAGATGDQFKRWETWSDPTANARDKASDIEGGHGNGGKAFMVLGSTTDSSFESCYQGRRTRMGYENESASTRFKPGIALEDKKPIENLKVESVRKQFDRCLAELGIRFEQLPKQAQETFVSRQAYTVAQVNGIKDWSKAREDTIRRLVAELPHAIEIHPQASLTIETCAVWFVIDGKVLGNAPAGVRYPDPFPGFTEPIHVPVPNELVDPASGESVSTGPSDEAKLLTLRTSAKSLRTEELRALHVIRVRNSRNVVGLWSVSALCPGASSGFVFGAITVPVLEVPLMSDAPLFRSVESWVTERVVEVADRIQLKMGYTRAEQDSVNERLAAMRNAMSEFLKKKPQGKRTKFHRTGI